MKTQYAIISTKDFLNEKAYSDFLTEFETNQGKIENVITRKCANRKDEMILEIIINEN